MEDVSIFNTTNQNWICLDSPHKRKLLIYALEIISHRGIATMEQVKILKDLYAHEHIEIPEPLEKVFELFEQEIS